ncbi:MAG: cupin-like domain-containing protein [Cyanobacteriota bacterium]|nr:cupin-like domain-containing protein [Cyanobacteriota bacterium]
MAIESTNQTTTKPENNVNSVPRFPAKTLTEKSFFESYKKQGIPAVITGLLEGESEWNLDYLCQQLGDREFPLRRYGKDRYQQDKRHWKNIGSGVTGPPQPFSEYAAMVRSGEARENDIYMAKCSLKNTPLKEGRSLPKIAANLQELGFNKSAGDFNIWLGPGGHVECLHYDLMDGTLIQLHGVKKVVLFPPSQTANLYPFGIYVHLYRGFKLRCWFSQVYPENPNLKTFPQFESALQFKQEIYLQPGEALFIPAGWWHEVTALGEGMVCSVNRFWRVYPTSRAVFSWSRLRVHLGSVATVPYVLVALIKALFGKHRKEKVKEILRSL